MPPRPRLLQHHPLEPPVGPTLRGVCNLNPVRLAISGCDDSGAPPMLVSPQGSTLRPAWPGPSIWARRSGVRAMAGELDIIGLDLGKVIQKAFAKAMEGLSPTAFEMGFSIPLVKVDHARREVVGVATSETRDYQGDSVSYEAAKSAFANWTARNVREQHDPMKAIGKAVSVVADDKARTITVTSRISRGAEDSWKKVTEGVLQAYSIGGQRLRSTMLPDGTRRIDEMRLSELSLVDNPANPDCSIHLVKSHLGTPTFTDVIASDSEPDFSAAADSSEQVAQTLRCGVRPLPTEVSRALFRCGSPIICNQLDLQDLRQKGPGLAKQLSDCAIAMRRGDESQMEKAREAAAFVLAQLPCRRDLAKWRGKTGSGDWSASGRGLSTAALRGEIAKALVQLREVGQVDAIEKLEVGAMALHTVEQAAGVAKSGTGIYLTREEIQGKCDELETRLKDMQASGAGLPGNAQVTRTPAYHELEGEYFKWRERLKSSR